MHERRELPRPDTLAQLRQRLRSAHLEDEATLLPQLLQDLDLSPEIRRQIEADAAALVQELRSRGRPGLMEVFLAEYGLSTEEGVALMCLAEALLRVPDTPTVDALIRDKIAAADWSRHLGQSSSPLVNASTWALMLTGKVLGEEDSRDWDITRATQRLIGRAGEPVVRGAVAQAMRVLGQHFVLGRNIEEALARASEMEVRGYVCSYDMLGEAARTAADAQRYFLAYSRAISAIADRCASTDVRQNPGISVKLSALHPRYEYSQRGRVLEELVPRVAALALHAKNAQMGFNIDAEEADRLDLSLDVIEAVLRNPDLRRWDGLGLVVQAYGRRASFVLDWLYELAGRHERRIMVRLVKGAYWDTEIKLNQVLGVRSYPVFTRKVLTDVAYLACARKLLRMADRIYPQFATHNAHTLAAVLRMAGGFEGFEFQRLHGMGEMLHERVRRKSGRRSRIYAPVGVHEDLLAYLVRRLLENGANSSFVHQILNEDIPVERVVRDPVSAAEALVPVSNPRIPAPPDIYGPERRNAKGWNLADPVTLAALDEAMEPFRRRQWRAAPIVGGRPSPQGARTRLCNPAKHVDVVGEVVEATPAQVDDALVRASRAAHSWSARSAADRADSLLRIADAFEANAAELMALCIREAGKIRADAIAEIREAVDFCRYYAVHVREQLARRQPRGVFVCISPWNFPLAIFTGQIAAALVAGNAVIAKPAEQTPLIAARAVELMLTAGVPPDVLHLLPGDGARVGGALVADRRVSGVCFTGSTETARRINQAMAAHLAPEAPLIAETGGLNAMIVDSTALPEQAVRDILASAFQSSGQRCSALRLLCVQEEITPTILRMLTGAMDELAIGDPWELSTDTGPVIDQEARDAIEEHCTALSAEGRALKRLPLTLAHDAGTFVPPSVYRLDHVEQLTHEIFGPVLHVVTYKAAKLTRLVERLNATGYGLTLGVHTRVDGRIRQITERARIGNIYVNRNQIGAVVGVQPFGGEGLSGTGPKAGGPHYLLRFTRPEDPRSATSADARPDLTASTDDADGLSAIAREVRAVQEAWDRRRDRPRLLAKAAGQCAPDVRALVRQALADARAVPTEPITLPGPAGESNRLSLHGRGLILCLGPDVLRQTVIALATGNAVLAAAGPAVAGLLAHPGLAGVARSFAWSGDLAEVLALAGLAGVAFHDTSERLREARQHLAAREGPLIALIEAPFEPLRFVTERTLSIDITAAGGNVSLLAAGDDAA
jgi:RHH-type proline utilization regulon transcriptional repressor/proline dehydrogenase/delta 1-pyrroline-5-carboxylate dehydrogenase